MNPAALRASRGVLLATFLGAMDSTVMGTIGPTVASRFHALVWEPWMITAFMLCTTLATPVFGRLADTTDNRRLYAVALTVFAAGSAWTALSPSMDFLLIGRIIQGLGAGGLFTMGLILLGRLFTGPTRATMQARQSAMWGIAAVLGPTLGGVAALGAGWRLLFAINVPLAWMAIRVMRAVELPPPDQQAPPLDRAGLALLTIVLVAVLALPTLWATGEPVKWLWAALGTALIGGSLLLAVERRIRDPLIPWALWRHPVVRRTTSLAILASALIYSLVTLVPLWTRQLWHADALTTGWVTLPIPLGWAIGSIMVGRRLKSWGFRRMGLWGTGIFGLGIASLDIAPRFPLPLIIGAGGGLLAGVGMGSVIMTGLLLVQSTASVDTLGAATGLYNFGRNLGNALGPGVLGGVAVGMATIGHPNGLRASTAGWLHALNGTWLGIVALTLGVAILLMRFPQHVPNPDPSVDTWNPVSPS
ncbi:drug resistance transporter, EmrB/QacA subfamily [Sulfobacillus acidophilus TPY]|uniref:Major facilitator superfamily MFS_1 n=1 Tax=Sulfobacillus acidophilus (strain ATCC 700253 / DSM 10332 / NAL) TaxID=679936 RepID=G8TYM7_SULAD|nr:drug resistance transporter, EmrB/QacA subfamily [Sulfobacillus acidophilus TPY]AEW03992.1 major facilitator superfamily MFS_1 [Sulfobacillus acidophilus DSM 10332]